MLHEALSPLPSRTPRAEGDNRRLCRALLAWGQIRPQAGPSEGLRSHPSPARVRGRENAEQGWAWRCSARVAGALGASRGTLGHGQQSRGHGEPGRRAGQQHDWHTCPGPAPQPRSILGGTGWPPHIRCRCTCSQLGRAQMSPDEPPLDENTDLHTCPEQLRGR